jgi:hypothetical protein
MAGAVIAAAEAQLRADEADQTQLELDALDAQEQRLIDLALAGPVTPKMREARQQIAAERRRLDAARASRKREPKVSLRDIEALRLIRDERLRAVVQRTPVLRSTRGCPRYRGDWWCVRKLIEPLVTRCGASCALLRQTAVGNGQVQFSGGWNRPKPRAEEQRRASSYTRVNRIFGHSCHDPLDRR